MSADGDDEESRSALKVLRASFLASLSRKSRHSRESGNPPFCGLTWTPACAGVTTLAIFTPLGGPQAHGHSESKIRALR